VNSFINNSNGNSEKSVNNINTNSCGYKYITPSFKNNNPVKANISDYTNLSLKTKKINESTSKKMHSRQISINISSIQSPEHKAIYHYEENNKGELKLDLQQHNQNINSNKPKHVRSISQINTSNLPTRKISSSKKINLTEYLSASPKKGNEQPHLYMNFLIDRYGDSKIKKLISLVEDAENPFEILNNIETIKGIVGDDYKIAVKYLMHVIESAE
jgi:hypothetical protein